LIAGHNENDLLNTDSMNFVHPDDRNKVRENAIRMLKGEKLHPYEYRIISKYGEVRWCMERVSSIEYGNVQAVLGNVMDINERKQIEEKLLASERLATLGQFSGNISHELRNPLGVTCPHR